MGWQEIDSYLNSRGVRIGKPTLGQTTGGTHVKGSFHYAGDARDYGTSDSDAAAIFTTLAPLAVGPDAPIRELFYDPLGAYDEGSRISPVGGHSNHVHVAIRHGVKLSDQSTANPSFLDSINPLKTIPDAAGNLIGAIPGADALGNVATSLGSIAAAIGHFMAWIALRGKFLLLAGGGLLMIVAGFVLLSKDLTMPTVLRSVK